MSKDRCKKLISIFKKARLDNYPYFYNLKKILDKGLWVLALYREELNIDGLSAEEISTIILENMREKISSTSITKAFNRSSKFVYSYKHKDKTYFKILKKGEERLSYIKNKEKQLTFFYFNPNKKYTSKRIFIKEIFYKLKRVIKIVDPYIDLSTLDSLKINKNQKIKLITVLDNLNPKKKRQFIKEFKLFRSEYPNVELRDYPHRDIHDRYILSKDKIIFLGHSFKDLGKKDSFGIVLNRNQFRDISATLENIFKKRWNKAIPI